MSISYTYPGVYIQELPSPVHTIAAAATSIAAFVGYTPSGIDNRAEVIFSFADFERQFGGLASNSELSYAVQQFYQNGGAQAYVVRVPMHGAEPASVTFDELVFTALSSGSWANGQLLIDVNVQNINLTTASGDPLAFNLTITDLLHQTTESFPNVTLNQGAMNYVANVVNDPDNGSQLVGVTVPSTPPTTPVAVTGIVGETITPGTVATAVGGSATAATVLDTAAAVLEADAIPTANETAANPGAATSITSQALGAGTYAVTWTATLSGTTDAGDLNNFGLYNGTELVAAAVNMTAAGMYPQPSVTVTIPAGGATVAIKNIAASASGAVYAAQLTTIVLPILPIAKAANEIAANPGAGTSITSQAPGAGTYAVTWTATLSGTTDAADLNNFELYNGTDPVAAAVNMTAAGTYPQPPVTVTIPAGGATLAIKNIAASTSGAVYAAQLSAVALPATTANETAANPDAGTLIISQALGAGTYAVTWTATLSGTTDAADLNNFGLYNGTELVAAAAEMTAAGTYPQAPLTVVIPAGGATLAIKNIAASTSGAVYAAQLTTTVWSPSYNGFGLDFSTSSPSASVLPPLPSTVTVFPPGTPIPQSAGGLVAQLQQAINSVLAVQMPGASVQCSVSQEVAGAAWPPTDVAIRVNAMLPQQPDAVVTFSPPSSGGLLDVSGALGLGSPASGNVAHYALGTGNSYAPAVTGGETAASAPGIDGPPGVPPALPTSEDLIGKPALFTGIYALQKVALFNLLSIPDATRALPIGSATPDPSVNPAAIYSTAITLCDQRRAFLLVDPPPSITTVTGAVDWKTSGLGSTDPNGAAFWPRLRLPDPLNSYNLRTFAPSGVVAGVYATTDGSSGVWKAPAGIQATLSGVQSMTYQLSDLEQGLLNPLGLNCFRTFPVYGSVLWGARTLAGADAIASQWKYVPVRRMALFLEQSLYQGTQWVVFEPNDEPLWAAIRLNIGSFMQTYFLKGAFQGQTPDQAYFVKCDSETTTQTDIDNGIVNILVGFAPLQPAEFVVIQIEQLTGQASS